MTRKNTITNACFSYAYLMETAEQITYLWIIRSGGGRGGGPYAISDADRYEGPICTGICTAGGARGPAGGPPGRGGRLLPPVHQCTSLLTAQTTQQVQKLTSWSAPKGAHRPPRARRRTSLRGTARCLPRTRLRRGEVILHQESRTQYSGWITACVIKTLTLLLLFFFFLH